MRRREFLLGIGGVVAAASVRAAEKAVAEPKLDAMHGTQAEVEKAYPPGVRPAYDGLVISV